MNTIRVAFGQCGPGLMGGVMATEDPFVAEIEKSPGFAVTTFQYGRSGHGDQSNVVRFFGLLRDLVLFVALLVKYKPDVVHLNSAYFRPALLRDPAYILISKIFKTRVFIKYHGSDAKLLIDRELPWRSFGRFCVEGASGIGLLSSEEKRNFALAGFKSDNVWQVKNVVNCERFENAIEIPRKDCELLVISRIIPQKGVFDSVESLSSIIKVVPHVNLVCVGDGPDLDRVKRRVRQLGLENSVRFTGRVPEADTFKFYLSSSILIFPTYFDEGFPMNLFQALAAGMPVVTTRTRAAADYLREPANCLWVEPRSPEDLAEKTLHLLGSPELMQSMSTNNRQLAKQFTALNVAPEYQDIYSTLCSSTKSPPSRSLR